MKITRKSIVSGIERVRDIPVDPNDYISWERGFVSIYDAMPYLSDTDREFILSGIVPGEWEKAFSEVEAV